MPKCTALSPMVLHDPQGIGFSGVVKIQLLQNSVHASTVPFSLDVIPLASARELTVSVKLLASANPKALGEASVTALYDVRRLQSSADPLTIQQELRSPGSTVRSQR
ncbi:hypothetical protein DPMN_121405 [Dreissena polymorpha]|uniref:Uncharacterized protein n=1 Tax=Dreissena polymorpha TaxID=45954 RepID=A0A9D4JT31_DREPO|nr:hypothetical protein DPMN_121405 [Dreissena polymorpha]